MSDERFPAGSVTPSTGTRLYRASGRRGDSESEVPAVEEGERGDRRFVDAVHETYELAETIMLSKHCDYGPGNITGAPGGPMNGLLVRMHDKIARIVHLTGSGREPLHEPIVDSLVDLANYALIGVLVARGEWPGTERGK